MDASLRLPRRRHQQIKPERTSKDGYVSEECKKAIYGEPKGGIFANRFLEKFPNEYSNYQRNNTNGFWTHKTMPIQFALVVDNFAEP